MKGLLIAAVMLLVFMFLPEKAEAQCNQSGCQQGIFRIVPQLQRMPGNASTRYVRRFTLANLLPWNWNGRLVAYRRQAVFNPSGPWRSGGYAIKPPRLVDQYTPPVIKPQTVRYTLKH